MADAHEVISAMLEEIDKEYMAHQALHHRYHRSDDEVDKTIHKCLVDLCRRLLKEIPKGSE